MGSTLTVDNIVGATAAANVKLPAGTILQTVTAETGGYVTHNTSTYADTGLQCSITPKFASSHIIVVVSCQASQSGANGQETACRVLRGGSVVIGAEGQRFVYGRIEDGSSNMHTGGMQTLIRKDTSHNSTSSQTYKFQHRIISGGGVVRYNDFSTGSAPTQSTMMLMEISQ